MTTGGSPTGIAVGPDKNIWFTERDANRIGRLQTAAGIIAQLKATPITVGVPPPSPVSIHGRKPVDPAQR